MARARIWTSAGLACLLIVASAAIELFVWPFGNLQLHTLLEVVATLVALVVGAMALVYHGVERQNMILFVGVGFVGAAMLDGYHAVVTSTFFDQLFPFARLSLIPWSWYASRTFLSIVMFLSWFTGRREQQLGVSARISETTIYTGALLLALASFCFFAFVPLGRVYYPEFMLERPAELVAAVLFVVALGGYFCTGAWRHHVLEYWLVNSLIVNFLCQAVFMSRSHALFDGMFAMAQALKILSYALILIGLLSEMQATWRRAQRHTAAFAESARELEFAYTAAQGVMEPERIPPNTATGDAGDGVRIKDFDDALDLWARQARTAIGAHQCAVSYIPGGVFKVAKHAVSLSDKYAKYRAYKVWPTGEGIWKLVATERRRFCLTDDELKSHPAWRNFSNARDEHGLEHPPMRGWLAVPILSGDQEFVGVVQLSDKYEGDFTAQELTVLMRLASLIGPAFSLQYAHEKVTVHGISRAGGMERAVC